MRGHPEKEVGRFGEQLRLLRDRAGLTQEELAERARVTPHAISALERGTRTRPYPHTIRSLADALQMSDAERARLIAAVPNRRVDGLPAQPGAAAAVPGLPGRHRVALVLPPTKLYGRARDIAEVCSLARSGDARLITLTGPGGVGKTRLALAVCEELAADYPDGVVQIALSSLAEASEVIGTIGRALDLVGGDAPDAVELLVAHLRGLRLLLVLDNFEHLLSAAVDVGQLVSSCPTITVIVTSRSPLRIRGEREFAVGPLALPPEDVTTPEALAASASGALVLDRAVEVSPPLSMTGEEVRALGQLCQRLAGIPLAIELAAAHLRLLTPQSLLDRLDDISATGARDLPARQRTMRATLHWSYRLLTSEQQRLFRMLSVFRGGATLTAVEEVAAASGEFAAADVLGLMETLVEHSLVVVRPDGTFGRRYDMLEPIAQYARSLVVGEEAARFGRAHAQVFLTLAESAAVGYEGADQVLWLGRTQADEANILVAVDRSLDGGHGDTAGRMVWAMWLYWWLRGQPSVGRRRAAACLAVDLSPAVLARVHLTAATMAYAAGDLPASAYHWETAGGLGLDQGDPEVACAGRAGMGLVALGAGDHAAAERLFRQALSLGLEAGDRGVWLRSLVHVWLGTILLVGGDPTRAVGEIDRGLALARGRGDRLSTYVALFNLSQAAISVGDPARARTYLTEGIALSQQTQDLANLAYFLDALAVVESAAESAERVAVLIGAAQSLRETVGAKVYGYYLPDESLRTRAEHRARNLLGDDAYDDAVDAGRALDPTATVEFALGSAG